MAKPSPFDWTKYYAKYGMFLLYSVPIFFHKAPAKILLSISYIAHVKVKRASLYTLVIICLPCTCGMSGMWTDNAPWWDLPKRPDAPE